MRWLWGLYALDRFRGRVVMFQSAIAWMLTAAFLVTLPVTGTGYCPCRFAELLRGPTPTADPVTRETTPPQPCKGCCHAPQDDTPVDAGNGRLRPPQPPDAPGGTPCDHTFVLDSAPAGASGERSGAERGAWDSDVVIAATARPHSHLTHKPVATSSDLSMPASAGPHFFRYAHAFRC